MTTVAVTSVAAAGGPPLRPRPSLLLRRYVSSSLLVDELVDVSLVQRPDAGRDLLWQRIDSGGSPVRHGLQLVVLEPVEHPRREPHFVVALLDDRADDVPLLHLLEHVVVPVHRDDLELAGLAGL